MGKVTLRQGDQALLIDGVEVTASAAELNATSGTGLSAAELGVLDGVTPGTSAASKAVVLGADSKVSAMDITALKVNGVSVSGTVAGTAALLAAGGGASIAYTKAATGTNDLLANAVGDRTVLIIVHVDEIFADGNTTQTVFTIGEESGSASKFAASAAFASKAAGSILTFAGTLTSAKKLRIYATPAVGTGTGGITATVLAIPASA